MKKIKLVKSTDSKNKGNNCCNKLIINYYTLKAKNKSAPWIYILLIMKIISRILIWWH